MLSQAYQKYLFLIRPKILGFLTKILYSRNNIKFGKKLLCDSIPRIIVSKRSKLLIDDNIYIRKDVEIRTHKNSIIKIEKNVRIDKGVRILSTNNSKISIGKNSSIGLYSIFNGGDNILIGESCLISGFVYIQTSMHKHLKGKLIKSQGYIHKPINIKNDVWLGAHSVILPGCKLGQGSIIGSNAVVTKSISDNEIFAGVPARKIKSREK